MGKRKQYNTGAKTGRGRRVLAQREAKVVETAHKTVLMLYGTKKSAVVKEAMDDLYTLKRREAVRLSRLNDKIRPFEAHGGEVELERLCKKANEASLFVVGSSTKKRPHNLVFGRMFDGLLYDAVEVGVEDAGGAADGAPSPSSPLLFMRSFEGKSAVGDGNKPMVAFASAGDFETDEFLSQFKDTMQDLFRGPPVSSINLAGVDRVVCFSVDGAAGAAGAAPGAGANNVRAGGAHHRILMRQYRVLFKKSGTKVPRVALEEMGPRLTLVPRRYKPPAAEQRKAAAVAVRPPVHMDPAKRKNVERDVLLGKVGKLYVPSQARDVDAMPLRKMKGFKRKAAPADAARGDAVGGGAQRRKQQRASD